MLSKGFEGGARYSSSLEVSQQQTVLPLTSKYPSIELFYKLWIRLLFLYIEKLYNTQESIS